MGRDHGGARGGRSGAGFYLARVLHLNPGLILALRTARAWGVRPCVWLDLPNPGDGWGARDRSLAEALTVYEASLNEVGIPSWLARDPERRFVIDEVVDGSLAALDEGRDEMSRGGGKNYGVRLVVMESEQPESQVERPSVEARTKRNTDETLG